MKIETKTKLLSHQIEAFEKLKNLKVGALYMDMGTGKTRTMIEIIKDKIDRGKKIDKILWFCPCSAKENIAEEFKKHISNGQELFSIFGIESLSSNISLCSYLYGLVKKENCLIVVDESTKIKNFKAIRTQRLIDLGRYCEYKFILTGTPVPRDEADLFGQWYFLDWRILGYKSLWSFTTNHVVFHKEYYNRPVGIKNNSYLVKKTAPYSYLIKIDDCVDLPDKVYDTRYFSMNYEQSETYRNVANILLDEIDEWKPSTIYRLFNNLQNIIAGYKYKVRDGKIQKLTFTEDRNENPRLDTALDLIECLKDKVIIFCKFTDEINILSKYLEKYYGKNNVAKFYGDMSFKERDAAIDKFKKEARFLVANSNCAGYSHNLQFCHTVIFYNNDWNFGTREQSERRIYRIGQDHKCLYIDLVASGTVDEHIKRCLNSKEMLSDYFLKLVQSNQKKDLKDLVINFGKREEQVKIVGELVENIY